MHITDSSSKAKGYDKMFSTFSPQIAPAPCTHASKVPSKFQIEKTRFRPPTARSKLWPIILVWLKQAREELRFAGLHLKTTASCAMLFRDVTAMLVKPKMGHSLCELAKLKIPLVGSVRL